MCDAPLPSTQSRTMSSVPAPTHGELPEMLRPFLWDCDFDRLSWAEHREFLSRASCPRALGTPFAGSVPAWAIVVCVSGWSGIKGDG